MPSKNVQLAVVTAVLLAGLGWLLAGLVADRGASVVEWEIADELQLPDPPVAPEGWDPKRADATGSQDRTGVTWQTEPAGRPAERSEVAISGRVLDVRARPLAGATVVLEILRGRGGPRRTRARTRIQQPTVTGGDGRFAFRGAAFADGAITLRVTDEQHAPLFADRELPPGQRELDVGDLRLRAGGVVVGSVADHTGAAVPDAVVRLEPLRGHRLGWDPDRETLLPEVRADGNGQFRIAAVMPGQYRVDARAARHARGRSELFRIEDGVEERVEPIRLDAGHEVAGTVYDPKGRGVEGAEVQVVPLSRQQRPERTHTAADGAFRVPHVSAGLVTLRVRATGYVTFSLPELDPAGAASLAIRLRRGPTLAGVVVDAQTGAPVTRYGVRLRRLGGLPGRLRDDAETARLRTELTSAGERLRTLSAGPQAEQVRREIDELNQRLEQVVGTRAEQESRRQQREHRFPLHGGATDEEAADRPAGRFELRGLDEGVYVVDVASPDHQRLTSEPVEVRAEAGELQLTLRVERGLQVSGSVLSAASGTAIGGAAVELVALRDPPAATSDPPRRPDSAQRGVPVLSTRTDERGRFRFAHGSPGRYAITARADGHAIKSTEPFELSTDREGLELELVGLARLWGTVRGIPTGREAETRVIAFGGSDRLRHVTVSGDGSYEIDDLEPGGYGVRAGVGPLRTVLAAELGRSEGSAEVELDVTLDAGADTRFDPIVVVEAFGAVVGAVLRNGEPGGGLGIELLPVVPSESTPRPTGSRGLAALARFTDRTRADPAGAFAFRSVPAGRYLLAVQSADGMRSELLRTEIEVHEGTEQRHDLAVTTARVAAVVAAPEGVDRASLDGELHLFGGGASAAQGADPTYRLGVRDGRVADTEVASGAYDAVLRVRGWIAVERPVSLAARKNRLEFALGDRSEEGLRRR